MEPKKVLMLVEVTLDTPHLNNHKHLLSGDALTMATYPNGRDKLGISVGLVRVCSIFNPEIGRAHV